VAGAAALHDRARLPRRYPLDDSPLPRDLCFDARAPAPQLPLSLALRFAAPTSHPATATAAVALPRGESPDSFSAGAFWTAGAAAAAGLALSGAHCAVDELLFAPPGTPPPPPPLLPACLPLYHLPQVPNHLHHQQLPIQHVLAGCDGVEAFGAGVVEPDFEVGGALELDECEAMEEACRSGGMISMFKEYGCERAEKYDDDAVLKQEACDAEEADEAKPVAEEAAEVKEEGVGHECD
jgi:hypothetical protein